MTYKSVYFVPWIKIYLMSIWTPGTHIDYVNNPKCVCVTISVCTYIIVVCSTFMVAMVFNKPIIIIIIHK